MTRKKALAMRIKDVPFTTRARNCLLDALGDNATVQELLECSEMHLLSIPNFGRVSLADVKAWLAQHKLKLNYASYATFDTASNGRVAK